eukprot:TRINITY_DN2276_c0_g2_i1.p1 TRINITY_DN2276_c0_g2~~TRINITY_DN2276_c0_g2_i1.p1  ORF type:complete len:943 (+),score=232.74 TRINITY_DN2276_c0_g2_i1:77-2905(+)
MEVFVTEHALPQDAIVSIRFGTTRRQAPLESVAAHPLKFPSSLEAVCEPLKIDVLRPIASTRLVLHPHEDNYVIGFDQSDDSALQTLSADDYSIKEDMFIGLNIKPGGGNDKPDGAVRPGSAMPVKFQDAAASAKDYLEQHGLLRYVQSLLHAIIQVKPKDPYSFMMEQLGASKSKAATVRSRPSSAIGGRTLSRPSSAIPRARQPFPPQGPPPGPGESSPLRHYPDIPQGPIFQELSPQPKPPDELPIKEEDVPAPKVAPPSLPEEPAVGGGLEPEVYSSLAEKTPAAATASAGEVGLVSCEGRTGTPADAKPLATETGSPSADTAPAATALAAEVELVSCEGHADDPADSKPPAVEPADAQPQPLEPADAVLEATKQEMREVFTQSLLNGKLDEAVKKTLARNQTKQEEHAETLAQASDMLMTEKALPHGEAKETAPAVPRVTDEIADVKANLQKLLTKAVSSGQLEEQLQKIFETKTKKEEQAEMLMTEKALPGGEAKETAPAVPRVTDEIAEVKANLQKLLTKAVSGGQLEEQLQKIFEPKKDQKESLPPTEEKEAQSPPRSKLQELLATASEEKLTEAIHAAKVCSQPRSPTAKKTDLQAKDTLPIDEEVQNIKVQLRSKLAEASETGQLAEVLQKMPKYLSKELPLSDPEADLQALKAKLRSVMQADMESGQLQSKLASMSQKAGLAAQDDLEEIKGKLRDLLAEGASSGKLKEALSQVGTKAKASQEEAQILETKEMIKVLLRQATESGELGEALRNISERKTQEASAAINQDEIKAKLCIAMRQATENGTLEDMLRRTIGKQAVAEPQDEMETIKAALRGKLSEAFEAGTLEGALLSISLQSKEQKSLTQSAHQDDRLESEFKNLANQGPAVAAEGEQLQRALQQEVGIMKEEIPDLRGTVDRYSHEVEELRRANAELERKLAELEEQKSEAGK